MKSQSDPAIIDTVPNEIWSAILESSFSFPDHDLNWKAGHLCKRKLSVIVAMSQVCARWREITLNNTSLWTDIYVGVGEGWKYPNENLVNLWIKRSASQPLFVNLEIGEFDSIYQPMILNSLIAFLDTISRWRVGRIIINSSWASRYLWNNLVPFFNAPAPLLGSLHIVTTITALPSNLWTNSPSLAKLVITSYDYNWPLGNPGDSTWLSQSHIPYHQLTHFRLTTTHCYKIVTWAQLHIVLSSATNLVSCFLGGVSDFSPWDTDEFTVFQKPVVLQRLKHLYLEASGQMLDSLPGHLHCVVIAPSLKTFTIFNTKEWDHTSYTTFINQSSCQLEELHLVYVNISSQDFLECMQLSPTLKVIHLHSTNSMANPEVRRAMMEWSDVSDSFNLVPKLQVLSFQKNPLYQYVTDEYKTMADMLKKRRCPRKGSSASFTTLAMPFNKQRLTKVTLQKLCGDPWNLKVVSNNDMYTISSLWSIYSNAL